MDAEEPKRMSRGDLTDAQKAILDSIPSVPSYSDWTELPRSATACALADEWAAMKNRGQRLGRAHGTAALRKLLIQIEALTSESPLRKVREEEEASR